MATPSLNKDIFVLLLLNNVLVMLICWLGVSSFFFLIEKPPAFQRGQKNELKGYEFSSKEQAFNNYYCPFLCLDSSSPLFHKHDGMKIFQLTYARENATQNEH